MTQIAEQMKNWTNTHPYLEGIAKVHLELEKALKHTQVEPLQFDAWERYLPEYAGGQPLLRTPEGEAIVGLVASALEPFARRVASAELPTELRESAERIASFCQSPSDAQQLAETVIDFKQGTGLPDPGLARLMVWLLVREAVTVVGKEFEGRRDEQQWMRSYCPTCGAEPGMSELLDMSAGKQRSMVCGLCNTRWVFHRVGCAYCGSDDQETNKILEIEGEDGLRLDCCDECKGYVKTCTAPELSELAAADWPTLHLDTIAQQQGYVSKGQSLYVVSQG